LPSEVIFSILSRLPVKSLLRFRCVSKQWRKLVSFQTFVSAHLRRSPDALLIHANTVQAFQGGPNPSATPSTRTGPRTRSWASNPPSTASTISPDPTPPISRWRSSGRPKRRRLRSEAAGLEVEAEVFR
ncbi:F-box protein at1g11270, partial [Phtheirospermum japonicum]